jgi:hypothetical protein
MNLKKFKMINLKVNWKSFLKLLISNIFIVIAVLPLFFIAIPFAILETAYLLEIRSGGMKLTFCVALLVVAGAVLCGRLLAKLLPAEDTNIYLPLVVADALISLAVMGVVVVKFFSFHYVTPNSSVLYYIFYDYTRLFLDTGFYRPALPAQNPSGTWNSLLTYNPALGATGASLFFGEGIEGFRRIFGILTATFNIGAIAWLGIFSRYFIGSYLPGIAMGFSMFVYAFQPAGLLQSGSVIGSHDLPLFYFAIAGIVLTLVIINFYRQLGRGRIQLLILFTLAVNIFGLSLRPYLLSLTQMSFLIFIYLGYRFATKKADTQVALPTVLSNRETFVFASMTLFIGVVGAYWFALLLVKYATPVIYAHSMQFRHISDIDYGLAYQIKIAIELFSNHMNGGRTYFSILHEVVACVSALLALIVILYDRNNRKPFLFLALIYLLMLMLPLISQTGMHWKSFYSISVLSYLVLPTLAMTYLISLFSTHFPVWKNAIYALSISSFPCVVLLPTILPTDEYNKLIINDQFFRSKVAELQQMRGGKIFVLRGGEPGGDGQTLIPKYYYWDNVFFFGDLDSSFKGSAPSLPIFLCLLKERNVTLIFDPTKLDILNHSGKFAYEGITRLLDNNPDLFLPKVQRLDGYKGVVYSVEYPKEYMSACK